MRRSASVRRTNLAVGSNSGTRLILSPDKSGAARLHHAEPGPFPAKINRPALTSRNAAELPSDEARPLGADRTGRLGRRLARRVRAPRSSWFGSAAAQPQ